MYQLIETFHSDLDHIAAISGGVKRDIVRMSLPEFYNVVRKIQYRRDTKPVEVVSRPSHILKFSRLGMDCKKKAILLGSFLRTRGIPYRLIGSSKNPNGKIHHVFPQAFLNGEWRNVDATYPHYRMYEKKAVTNAEVLSSD